jgi:ATP-dependent Clp protease ATP-binding subunit ClpC
MSPWDELMQLGNEEATAHCKRYLVEELLWVAVGRSSDTAVAAVFDRAGVPRQDFRRRIRGLAAASAQALKPNTAKDVKIADEAFTHFKKARQIAEGKGRTHPHPIDLLGVLCEQVPTTVEAILGEVGSSGAKLREACAKQAELPIPEQVGGSAGGSPLGGESILAQFAKDYSALARDKKIGPVIGRRKEILQVLQVLARKEKNNPVLVGEPGVGKTAIVEALAI